MKSTKEITQQARRINDALGLSFIVAAMIFAFSATNVSAQAYPSGMVGYWKFNGDLIDELGSYNGTMGSLGSYADGIINQGLYGIKACSNPYAAKVDNFPQLDSSFTVEAWIKPSAPPGSWQGSLTVAKWAGGYGGTGFILFTEPSPYYSSNYIFSWTVAQGASGKLIRSPLTYPSGKWYHVVAIRDYGMAGTELKLFVNGEKVASVSDNIFSIVNSMPLTFHGYLGGGCGWGMSAITMDEVAIYNRVLLDAEIQQHYQNGLQGLGYDSSINPPNIPPVLQHIGNKTVDEGQQLNFTISASDLDGNNLIYSASNLPAGAAFDQATGTFNWTPRYDQTGVYQEVLFTVTDNGTPPMSASEAIEISVGNVNRRPVLDTIEDRVANENQLLEFTVTASDPDGDSLVFSASNMPQGASFDPDTRIFSWTPTYAQSSATPYSVEFTVTDTGNPMGLDTKIISITVNNVNRIPVFSPVGSQTVNEEQLLEFYVSATDYDGDTVSYSVGSLPQGSSFNLSTGLFSWTPDRTQAGQYTVTFYASDNWTSGTIDVFITVGDVPTPTERINDIVTSVVALPVSKATQNSYLANVKKVGIFMEDGRTIPAINELNAFIKKVQKDIDHGKIDTATGNILMVKASLLIGSIQN